MIREEDDDKNQDIVFHISENKHLEQDARKNPKSTQANLSRHPGRRIYPGQDRIAWSGYNPPVSKGLASAQYA